MNWIIIIIALFLADQSVKNIILKNIALTNQIPVIDGFFYITCWHNKGAAWGIFKDQRIFLLSITLIAFVLLAVMFYNNKNVFFRYPIVFIAGGAIGNMYDRLFREDGVVDFLLFKFGSYEFPAFNIADSCIVIGTIFLILAMILEKDDTNKELSQKTLPK